MGMSYLAFEKSSLVPQHFRFCAGRWPKAKVKISILCNLMGICYLAFEIGSLLPQHFRF